MTRNVQEVLSVGEKLDLVGAAAGFKLDILLKLNVTHARNNKIPLMHFLSKVLLYLGCFGCFRVSIQASIQACGLLVRLLFRLLLCCPVNRNVVMIGCDIYIK